MFSVRWVAVARHTAVVTKVYKILYTLRSISGLTSDTTEQFVILEIYFLQHFVNKIMSTNILYFPVNITSSSQPFN